MQIVPAAQGYNGTMDWEQRTCVRRSRSIVLPSIMPLWLAHYLTILWPRAAVFSGIDF